MAQDRVPDTEEPFYRMLEAAVEAVFPGARVDRDETAVIHPDGSSDRVEMPCFRQEDSEGARLAVFSFEFPERTRAAVERSISVEEAVDGREPRLAVVTLDAEGGPLEARVTFLEPGGHLANCTSLELRSGATLAGLHGDLLEEVGNVRGPFAEVEFTSLHEHEGGLASMAWGGVFDAGESRYRLTWPAIVSLESGVMEIFQPEAFSGGVIRLRELNSGEIWTYRCPEADACLIPPEAVLARVSGR